MCHHWWLDECGTMLEWYWQGKTDVMERKRSEGHFLSCICGMNCDRVKYTGFCEWRSCFDRVCRVPCATAAGPSVSAGRRINKCLIWCLPGRPPARPPAPVFSRCVHDPCHTNPCAHVASDLWHELCTWVQWGEMQYHRVWSKWRK